MLNLEKNFVAENRVVLSMSGNVVMIMGGLLKIQALRAFFSEYDNIIDFLYRLAAATVHANYCYVSDIADECKCRDSVAKTIQRKILERVPEVVTDAFERDVFASLQSIVRKHIKNIRNSTDREFVAIADEILGLQVPEDRDSYSSMTQR